MARRNKNHRTPESKPASKASASCLPEYLEHMFSIMLVRKCGLPVLEVGDLSDKMS